MEIAISIHPDDGLSGHVVLLMRLLSNAHRLCDRDRETIEKWEFPETRISSARDSLIKMEHEILLLEQAKAVNNLSPLLFANLEEEIVQKEEKWRDDWIEDLLRGIIFKEIKEIEDLKKETQLELEALRTTWKDQKLRVETLQNQLAEKFKAVDVLETNVRTLKCTSRDKDREMGRKLRRQTWEMQRKLSEKNLEIASKLREKDMEIACKLKEKDMDIEIKLREKDLEITSKLREKDSEMARELCKKESEMAQNLREKDSEVAHRLGEKVDLLLELTGKKEKADKVLLEEAHRREYEALRTRALQAEELNASLSKETKRAHRLECDQLRVRALQAEEINAAFSKQTEILRAALLDNAAKWNQPEKELWETRVRSVGSTRMAVRPQNLNRICRTSDQCDLSRVKLESNSEPENNGDNPQTEVDLKKQQVGSKRLRDGGQNALQRTRIVQVRLN